MELSLGKLQQLVTVARCGSFSRAAVELNISQPALSRSVAAIEERYGFAIFNRTGHGVEATAAGAQVIAQAIPVLQTLRVFDGNLRAIGSGKAGQLALGLSPLLASEVLAEFARDFFVPDSEAQLRVMIRPGAGLFEALKNDEIELFFFPETHLEPSAEIDVETIGRIMPACVVRRGHPLAGRTDLTLADLAHFPWASSLEPSHAPDVPSTGRLICDNYHILREAIAGSDLIGICSIAFVERQLADGTLRQITVAGLPLTVTTIYMAKLRGRVHSPLAEEAVKRLRRHLA